MKIGGFRVELGEVEKTAESFPGVTASCVVVSSLDASRPRLFAFVTIDAAAALNIGEAAVPRALHAFLTAQLPNYMVPTAIEVRWPRVRFARATRGGREAKLVLP